MHDFNTDKEEKYFNFNLSFNFLYLSVLILSLGLKYSKIFTFPKEVFVVLSLIGLLPVIYSALKALFKKELTIDLLASIALVFSLLAGQWYSAAFINLMLTSARLFDLWTERRARKSIEKLLDLRPTSVKVKRGGDVVKIPLVDVKPGDLVIVETGKRIPVDGFVVEGRASINESILTGESVPVSKKEKDYVYESTLNESGSLIVKVDKVGDNSTFAKFVALVAEASRNRARVERMADKFTQWYIAITLVGAIVIWYFSGNILLTLSILLVVCADDIAVAVPLALTAAINGAAKRGILLKGSDVLEKISRIKTFLTDKTGTLTFGKPEVIGVNVFDGFSKDKLIKALGAAEIGSDHPTGRAIIKYLKDKKIKPLASKEINEVPGEGISVVMGGEKYLFGKKTYLTDNSIKIDNDRLKEVEKEEGLGTSSVLCGYKGELIGFASLQDKLRPSAKEVVTKTKEMGVEKWIMLTGDNKDVAKSVAEKVGIDTFESNVKPEEKLSYIKKIKSQSKQILAMIGDGVNDAAALALSDVSFSMGVVGSDAAIEASDVALMTDNLARIPEAMKIGQKTRNIIIQCFVIWGITNIIGLLLVFMGWLDPAGAATYNFLTDFIPIVNSLRAGVINDENR